MGRTIKKVMATIKLDEVVIDEELYPRSGEDWHVWTAYAHAMEAGAHFPPIAVATLNGKKILVDGRHRMLANKKLNKTEIDAEVIVGLTREEIFEEAIKRNVAHGKALIPYEKRLAAIKLRQWKYPEESISKLIQVPLDKLEQFVAQRLVNAITGETIAQVVVKSGLRNIVREQAEGRGAVNSGSLETTQQAMHSSSQVAMFRQLIEIIQAGMLDEGHKEVMKLAEELKKELNKIKFE